MTVQSLHLRPHPSRRAVVGVLLSTGLAAAAALSIAAASEESFLAENDLAMERMMAGMNVKPSGDVDRDFAAMMIPHHQGAIDMAVAELRHGTNEQLRRIAQEIVISQQQEIAVMRLALGQELPAPAAAPTQVPLRTRCPQVDQEHRSHH
ncbi:MAG TPA: DUF305 domain-containing protein [Burkholderiaceae bacterium]|nr:DUF305 domain-containing protein [Burkholderiaceae bacterium]